MCAIRPWITTPLVIIAGMLIAVHCHSFMCTPADFDTLWQEGQRNFGGGGGWSLLVTHANWITDVFTYLFSQPVTKKDTNSHWHQHPRVLRKLVWRQLLPQSVSCDFHAGINVKEQAGDLINFSNFNHVLSFIFFLTIWPEGVFTSAMSTPWCSEILWFFNLIFERNGF